MTEVDAAGVAQLRDASDALVEAYRGVDVKPGKGAAHARAVAEVLRGAGYPPAVQVAGLLHDVVEDTAWTIRDVRARFGDPVAAVVAALTEDAAIREYRPRKRALREQIARAVSPAIDVALADKIATLRYVLHRGARLPRRKRAHYAATAAMAAEAAGHTVLVTEVVALLALVDARDRRPAERA
jgi:(p)ppGpp synthase/HD superfamily hydrolase